MNFVISELPKREVKPRKKGLTMVMDKGLSTQEAIGLVEVAAPYIDIIKLGWSTSYLTSNLEKKLEIYHNADIKVCLGGTLFEVYLVRNQVKEYLEIIRKYGFKLAEISDGSIQLDHKTKCELITTLSKYVTVVSEVGSKDSNINLPAYKWIELMKAEINAGSWKVIAEAREGGNVGVFEPTHEVRSGLVDEILTSIHPETIMWEAPLKAQQVWFIKLLGTDVNLGNIQPNEVIPLETLRLGLRSDTFHHFLKKNTKISSNGL